MNPPAGQGSFDSSSRCLLLTLVTSQAQGGTWCPAPEWQDVMAVAGHCDRGHPRGARLAPSAPIWCGNKPIRPGSSQGAILPRWLRKPTRPACAPIASTHAWSARTATRSFIFAGSRSPIRDSNGIRGCPSFPVPDTSRGKQAASSFHCLEDQDSNSTRSATHSEKRRASKHLNMSYELGGIAQADERMHAAGYLERPLEPRRENSCRLGTADPEA